MEYRKKYTFCLLTTDRDVRFNEPSLTSEDWFSLVHEHDRESYRAALRECFRGKTAKVKCEYRILIRSAEHRWVEDHGLPIRNSEGRAIRLVGAVSDVTPRKRMELALRESEGRYQTALQAINESVYEWDIVSGAMYYSPRLHSAVGLTPEELKTADDWLRRIHVDDLPGFRAAMREHLRGETPRLEVEYRYRHSDGTWHWARQHGMALRDENGRATRLTGSTGDVTAEKTVAIENLRLMDELQVRTRELQEALEHQTAASNVLEIISKSPSDIRPVFDTIVETAARLCEAKRAFIYGFDGSILRVAASFNASRQLLDYVERNPIRPARHSAAARAALEQRTVHIADVRADPEYTFGGAQVDPIRTVLAVPMLAGNRLVGAIVVYRLEVRPFTEKQVALLSTFADQAVIAIENVRLFEQVQARTTELEQALEQQTATGEILRMISTSPMNAQPVFAMIAKSAAELCKARFSFVYRFDGLLLHLMAHHGLTPEAEELIQRQFPMQPGRRSAGARAVLSGRIEQIRMCKPILTMSTPWRTRPELVVSLRYQCCAKAFRLERLPWTERSRGLCLLGRSSSLPHLLIKL